MDRQQLWAPWRYEYVSRQPAAQQPLATPQPTAWQPGADHDCFLCRAAASYEDPQAVNRQNLVAWIGEHVFVVLNRFPYNNGHVMVAPHRHVGSLAELTPDEHLQSMDTLSRLTQRYAELMQAQGFNIGLNLGEVAGAGVPGHLHWHLVPRWQGDENFMPVVGSTKVIPQSLDALYELLREALQTAGPST